jgi:hypothetical protein
MAPIVICVTGPGSTGKSTIIHEFTAEYLKYRRAKGDVLGIFPMPYRGYAVGVAGAGDNPGVIFEGQRFLTCYEGLRVIIVACRTEGETLEAVKRFAGKLRARYRWVETKKIAGQRDRNAAIREKVKEIARLMPPR